MHNFLHIFQKVRRIFSFDKKKKVNALKAVLGILSENINESLEKAERLSQQ